MTRPSQVNAIQIARAQSATVTMIRGITQVPLSNLNLTNPISTAFTGAPFPSQAGTRDSATWFRMMSTSITIPKTLKGRSVDVRISPVSHGRVNAGPSLQPARRTPYR